MCAFHIHSSLLTSSYTSIYLILVIPIRKCLGKLLHEFHIYYSHAEWNFLRPARTEIRSGSGGPRPSAGHDGMKHNALIFQINYAFVTCCQAATEGYFGLLKCLYIEMGTKLKSLLGRLLLRDGVRFNPPQLMVVYLTPVGGTDC